MEGEGGKPLFTADDLGDFHEVVIHDVGEVVGGELVGALPQHLIIEDGTVDADVAADDVIDVYVLAGLDEESYHVGVAFGDEAVCLLLAECQGVAHLRACGSVVLELLTTLFGSITLCREFLRGVESDVCASGIQELLDIFLIDLLALALAIGTVVAAEADTLVELNAEPLERLDDIFLGSRHEACGVGVFNSEDEFSAVLTGEEIIV